MNFKNVEISMKSQQEVTKNICNCIAKFSLSLFHFWPHPGSRK